MMACAGGKMEGERGGGNKEENYENERIKKKREN